jgi:tetratricopeptide (TPR) repeat protein
MFRDALTFLSLVLVTILLFLVTFFLFRSFSAHRDELAKRWSSRGQAAISAGRPDQAIVALRTALSYAPGQRSYELLLAQALGNAGHTEESYNYFLSLWETQPGDGFINLSLARLAAKKNDPQAAINYYRAAIYGTWEGDGTVRRREVRLELARFLIAHHDSNGARTVILVAGGNAPGDVPLDLELAQLLEQAGDPRDALSYYQNALSHEPRNQEALIAAGRMQYDSGDFKEAHLLLDRADHEREATGHASLPSGAQTMLDTSSRVLELAPFKSLSAGERVARILKARDIAKRRFDQCSAQISSPGGPPASLQSLATAWTGKEATANRAALLKDGSEQDAAMKLVFDTEEQTSDLCGAPTGDDAALLLLAKFPKTMEP